MQNRYTTDTISSPGWIRTSDLSHVTGMSCPLNDGTVQVPRPGFEPGTPRSKRGMMVHFTIGASIPRNTERKARESNPHLRWENRLSRAARQAVSGYLPYAFVDCCPLQRLKWTAGELNPDFLGASQASSRVGPAAQSVIPDGLEPSLPGCGPGVFAAGPRDRLQ